MTLIAVSLQSYDDTLRLTVHLDQTKLNLAYADNLDD